MTDAQPKYAETSYTVDPNNPIPDEAPPAAGTSEDEGQVIREFQESASETQKLEREQAKEQAQQWAESDKPKPSEAADRARGQETTPSSDPDEGNDPDEGKPVNPDTQTTTLPSEVEPNQPVAPDPKEGADPQSGEEDEVPDGTTSEVMDWVGDDPDRAEQALEVEKTGKQRSTLIGHLEQIAGE